MIKPFNTKNWGGAGAKTRKAGDGQTSPTTVAKPTESSRTIGADPSIARNQVLRTTGNSVITATIISARPPERSSSATAPNISATKNRLHTAKTLNLVLLDGR